MKRRQSSSSSSASLAALAKLLGIFVVVVGTLLESSHARVRGASRRRRVKREGGPPIEDYEEPPAIDLYPQVVEYTPGIEFMGMMMMDKGGMENDRDDEDDEDDEDEEEDEVEGEDEDIDDGREEEDPMLPGGLPPLFGEPLTPFLDEDLMNMLKLSIDLSAESFEDRPRIPTDPPGFTDFKVFTEEPDQVIFGRFDRFCFAAFRGEGENVLDVLQSFNPLLLRVCAELGTNEDCCVVRGAWWASFFARFLPELTADIRRCVVDECTDPRGCELVLTGGSAGASIAIVAAVYYADLQPYTITFGEPASVWPNCGLINRTRALRFANTFFSTSAGLQYDYIAVSPRILGTTRLGQLFFLSDDLDSIAYIGTDVHNVFFPTCVNCHRIRASRQAPGITGYQNRIGTLYNITRERGFPPLPTTGFQNGSRCARLAECESKLCFLRECVGSLLNRCTTCVDNRQCASGQCRTGIAEGCESSSSTAAAALTEEIDAINPVRMCV